MELPVTVILRHGRWECWGCGAPATALPEMPQAAADAGSAHVLTALAHKPRCVLAWSA